MMRLTPLRLTLFSAFLVWTALLFGCGKPRLIGKDMEINPVIKTYTVDSKQAFEAAKAALVFHGYKIQVEDKTKGLLETYWQPTTSDSHYVDFFNRQDRGTVGAYHRLVVKIGADGSKSEVSVASLSKSIISNVKSTAVEEEKVHKKIADFTRKTEIKVTNVGLIEGK